jgi:chromosome segregation ATPase
MFQMAMKGENSFRTEIANLTKSTTLLRGQKNEANSKLKRCEEQSKKMQETSKKKEIECSRNVSNLEKEKQRIKNEAESFKIATNKALARHEIMMNISLKNELTCRNKVATLEKSKEQIEERLVSVNRSKEELQMDVENLRSEHNNTLDKCYKKIVNLTEALSFEKEVICQYPEIRTRGNSVFAK